MMTRFAVVYAIILAISGLTCRSALSNSENSDASVSAQTYQHSDMAFSGNTVTVANAEEFRTAYEQSKDGDTLRLRPGTYAWDVPIEITKNIQLIGEPTDSEPVVLESQNGAALILKAEQMRLERLSFRHLAAQNSMEDKESDLLFLVPDNSEEVRDNCSLLILGGHIELIECHVIASKKSGVVVRHKETMLVMKRCRIENVRRFGIWFQWEPQGFLEECVFSNCGECGFQASDPKTSVTLQKCSVDHCKGGFCTFYGAETTLEDCVASDCKLQGFVTFQKGTRSTMRRCTTHHCYDGLWVSQGAELTVEACDSYDHTQYGIGIDDIDSKLNVLRCRCYGNEVGIAVLRSTSCLLESCEMYKNTRRGLCVSDDAVCVAKRCKTYENNDGIVLLKGGVGVFDYCEIFANHAAGVHAQDDGSFVTMTQCKSYQNKKDGITVFCGASCKLTDCDCSENNVGIVLMDDFDSKMVVVRCKMRKNSCGALILRSAKPLLDQCEFYENTQGMQVRDSGSYPIVTRCEVHHNEVGISALDQGGGLFLKNHLLENVNQKGETYHWDIAKPGNDLNLEPAGKIVRRENTPNQ